MILAFQNGLEVFQIFFSLFTFFFSPLFSLIDTCPLVSCSEDDSEIVSLEMKGNNLAGILPSSLTQLSRSPSPYLSTPTYFFLHHTSDSRTFSAWNVSIYLTTFCLERFLPFLKYSFSCYSISLPFSFLYSHLLPLPRNLSPLLPSLQTTLMVLSPLSFSLSQASKNCMINNLSQRVNFLYSDFSPIDT